MILLANENGKMKTISKENLEEHPHLKNAYQTMISVRDQSVKISIDPDDVKIEETIDLVNKIMGNFDQYESNARKIIIQNYLKKYNDNWRDDDEEELDEKTFSKNLTIKSINFASNCSVDFYYAENGMFDDHSLIAQSFDGENFNHSVMYG